MNAHISSTPHINPAVQQGVIHTSQPALPGLQLDNFLLKVQLHRLPLALFLIDVHLTHASRDIHGLLQARTMPTF